MAVPSVVNPQINHLFSRRIPDDPLPPGSSYPLSHLDLHKQSFGQGSFSGPTAVGQAPVPSIEAFNQAFANLGVSPRIPGQPVNMPAGQFGPSAQPPRGSVSREMSMNLMPEIPPPPQIPPSQNVSAAPGFALQGLGQAPHDLTASAQALTAQNPAAQAFAARNSANALNFAQAPPSQYASPMQSPAIPSHYVLSQTPRRHTIDQIHHPNEVFLPRSPYNRYEDSDSDDESFELARAIRHAHRGSDPGHLPHIPMVGHAFVPSAAAIPPQTFLHPGGGGVVRSAPNSLVNPFLRPFSYANGYRPGYGYPSMTEDLTVLCTVMNPKKVDMKQCIEILVQRSPREIDSLRYAFRAMTGGTDIYTAFSNFLIVTKQKRRVHLAFMGLVLGPAMYDLWLMQNQNPNRIEDVLIEIFVGRHPEDLAHLGHKYQQQSQNMIGGASLASLVSSLATNEELLYALKICSEQSRQDPGLPVNQALVSRDVQDIIRILGMSFPTDHELLNILLRRNDAHIAQVALYYHMQTKKHLDQAIRLSTLLKTMTRKIAVHAVRTAGNITYRDAMLLRDAQSGDSLLGQSNDELLGVRVCRFHWYTQHWRQIKAEYLGLKGREFVDKMNSSKDGLFRDLMVSMALV